MSQKEQIKSNTRVFVQRYPKQFSPSINLEPRLFSEYSPTVNGFICLRYVIYSWCIVWSLEFNFEKLTKLHFRMIFSEYSKATWNHCQNTPTWINIQLRMCALWQPHWMFICGTIQRALHLNRCAHFVWMFNRRVNINESKWKWYEKQTNSIWHCGVQQMKR